MKQNERAGIRVRDPKSLRERKSVAQTCVKELELSIPCVIDEMDNAVGAAYAAWPDRLYVLDAKGRVALAGESGPRGFDPELVRAWLKREIGAPATGKGKPESRPAAPRKPDSDD